MITPAVESARYRLPANGRLLRSRSCQTSLIRLRMICWAWTVPIGNCHLDVLGGCSEEDLVLQMRYYADESYRAWWDAEFPDFPMPPREKPPFDRDRQLPQPEPPG